MLLVSPSLINSSPEFANHAVFSYFNGSVLTHELQPFDADGDSLSFEIVEPAGEECAPIAGYQFPDEVVPGPYSTAVNSSGVFEWNAPQLAGLYTVAIRCTEWREGEMIGAVTRDFMMCVNPLFTAIPDAEANVITIGQSAFDTPMIIDWNDDISCMVEILDTRGALQQRISPTGRRTMIATDGMTPGIYLVRSIDVHGAITTCRFVVAR